MEASYRPQASNGERQDANCGGHLTDEQFTELLLGGRPAWAQAHLEECAECREEAERVAGAIGEFSEQSFMWAERRAAARPRQAAERHPALLWLVRPQAWTAAALTIALAVGVGMTLQRERARTTQQAVTTAQTGAAGATKTETGVTTLQAATVAPATLKADNALLTAIDGELRADESTPASLYGLETDTSGKGTKSGKRTSN